MIHRFKRYLIFNFIYLVLISSAAYAEPYASINLLSPIDGVTTPDTRTATDPFIYHSSDSSIPTPTRFFWNAAVDTLQLTYTFYLSEDTSLNDFQILYTGLIDTECNVWNLKINQVYYWKITGRDSSGMEITSSIESFNTPDLWPRMIFIEGTINVRDIGGRVNMNNQMIPQGMFFRSAEFNQMYNITPVGLEQLKQLGIVCEIDLRNDCENPKIVMSWLRHYIRPVNDEGGGIDSYSSGLINTPGTICTIFKEMANKQNYPMIVHCRIGADRTATVVALVEALLGCSELQMGQDYIWTSLSETGRRDTASINWINMIAYIKSFDKEQGMVQRGCWNYLQTIGVSVKDMVEIRKIFLDDDRQPFPTLSTKNSTSLQILSPCKTESCLMISSSYISTRRLHTTAIFDLSGKKMVTIENKSNNNPENLYRLTPVTGVRVIQIK